mmetsp:Transcript_21915/g.51987  ORF Transcript_21915/g.51987 Transcript_21915/m.51987 type:complete len:95 (+) Transcript_21915:272-556(+)
MQNRQALVLGAGPAQVAQYLAQAQLDQWFSALAQALLHKPVALAHLEVLVVALAVASAVALARAPAAQVLSPSASEAKQSRLERLQIPQLPVPT